MNSDLKAWAARLANDLAVLREPWRVFGAPPPSGTSEPERLELLVRMRQALEMDDTVPGHAAAERFSRCVPTWAAPAVQDAVCSLTAAIDEAIATCLNAVDAETAHASGLVRVNDFGPAGTSPASFPTRDGQAILILGVIGCLPASHPLKTAEPPSGWYRYSSSGYPDRDAILLGLPAAWHPRPARPFYGLGTALRLTAQLRWHQRGREQEIAESNRLLDAAAERDRLGRQDPVATELIALRERVHNLETT